jgi:hypothetical protein
VPSSVSCLLSSVEVLRNPVILPSGGFSAPARPLSRVIGGAEAAVLLSIIIMMIFMLNIGKARQLLNQLEVT